MPPANDPILDDPVARALLEQRRDEAERLLNRVRIVVLVLLAISAFAYAPTLSPALRLANAMVLIPAVSWALLQQVLWLRRPERLPGWLPVVNPIVDTTAVSAIILGYGLASSASLALKSPVMLIYFLVLAARPIASSMKAAAAVAALAVAERAVVVIFFVATGRAGMLTNPLAAATGPAISALDEAAKLLFIAVGGAVATYATGWYERLVRGYLLETQERAKAQEQLAEARLHSLRLQLNPHFLFNTLNAITALIWSEPRGAEKMVTGLSELLRASLRSADEQEVTLTRELDHLQLYVDIQQTRFGDRLGVTFDIDPAARNALVPSLVLQPLVENAIRHGITPRGSGGRVSVRAVRQGDDLLLEVSDDGIGAETLNGTLAREGVGLSNTRERLRRLHGERHDFSYATSPGAGFAIRVTLPFRSAGDET
jgi:two-component sensor histidine kinase